ncbi:MAG: hypothetical protein ACJAZY_002072 [Spirosomataceae bacterium]|jgi:hypothetical protein
MKLLVCTLVICLALTNPLIGQEFNLRNKVSVESYSINPTVLLFLKETKNYMFYKCPNKCVLYKPGQNSLFSASSSLGGLKYDKREDKYYIYTGIGSSKRVPVKVPINYPDLMLITE